MRTSSACRTIFLHARESFRLAQAISESSHIPVAPVTVKSLVNWRRPNEPEELALLRNGRSCLLGVRYRLARTLQALRALPLIVVLNPYIGKVYHAYCNSFSNLLRLNPPQTEPENEVLVKTLKTLFSEHADMIPQLAKGFSQCGTLLTQSSVNSILFDYLKAHIGTRIVAEHHINLSEPIGPNFIGAVQTDLCPAEMAENVHFLLSELAALKFGFSPRLKIDIGRDVLIGYPPGHLEYILMELIKNSFWALCQRGEEYAERYPPTVTIIRSGGGVLIRIRDMGGGIAPEDEANVFDFSFTNVVRQHKKYDDDVDSSLAGLGYGLPLSRAYAEFLGGNIQLQSYFGTGVDAYVTLATPITSIKSENKA